MHVPGLKLLSSQVSSQDLPSSRLRNLCMGSCQVGRGTCRLPSAPPSRQRLTRAEISSSFKFPGTGAPWTQVSVISVKTGTLKIIGGGPQIISVSCVWDPAKLAGVPAGHPQLHHRPRRQGGQSCQVLSNLVDFQVVSWISRFFKTKIKRGWQLPLQSQIPCEI